MGHVHFLLDKMGLDEMGLDKMALNHSGTHKKKIAGVSFKVKVRGL